MDGTKFLASPADRNEGRQSRSTFVPNSLFASLTISSSDCGPGRGSGPFDLISSGISENKSSMDFNPIISSISCSLPRFGNWSTISLDSLEE